MGWTNFECRLCGGPGRRGLDDAGEMIIEHDCRETLRVPCRLTGARFANVKPLLFLRIVGQDFFIHKSLPTGALFVLTEYTSGRKVEMGESLDALICNGAARLQKMGQQAVLRKITAAILETGIFNKPERLRPEKESISTPAEGEGNKSQEVEG